MDDDAASKAGQMHRLHGEMLKARMAVLPYLLGWFFLVLVAALSLKATFGLEKNHVALILVLGWYIVLPVVFFIWAARTHIRKAAESQEKLTAREQPADRRP